MVKVPEEPEAWELTFSAGYVVRPGHGLDLPEVQQMVIGSPINVNNIPREFFLPLFTKAHLDCTVGITFSPEDGEQRNAVRTLVRQLAFNDESRKRQAAEQLAYRLSLATTKRSPSGLLVILVGSTGERTRVAMWKFPADEILQARLSQDRMLIQLIEDAFSRDAQYFKAAMFEGPLADTSFWRGKVEDNQARDRVVEVARYWIEDFLSARPAINDARGTRILSRTLRDMQKGRPPDQQRDVLEAASVARSQHGRRISLREFSETYLPGGLRDTFLESPDIEPVADEVFRIDEGVMREEFRFKVIVLDGNFTVRGPADQFDHLVSIEAIGDERVRVSLEGRITSRKFRRR